MGILIAIEGLDGSGKGTQTKRICERLKAKQLPFKTVSFPNYDSPAASL
ncbi:MAG TPA: thymidylate kinase, partial [Ruminococcaceae bacterium]|nr:thymidylate kinase [Oscillospiraceae bacterium]